MKASIAFFALCVMIAAADVTEKKEPDPIKIEEKDSIEGFYLATGYEKTPAGRKKYETVAEISRVKEVHIIRWTTGQEGIILLNGDTMSISWRDPRTIGISVYKKSNGKWVGTWSSLMSGMRHGETLELLKRFSEED